MFDRHGQTSAGRLIRAWRFFRAHPDGVLRTGLWDDPVWGQLEFSNWFRACLHAKINRFDPRTGRCFTAEWQAAQIHDARLINDRARRIRWSGRNLLNTLELQRRYPDIHNPPTED